MDFCEFKASLVYRDSTGSEAAQRNPVSKNKKKMNWMRKIRRKYNIYSSLKYKCLGINLTNMVRDIFTMESTRHIGEMEDTLKCKVSLCS